MRHLLTATATAAIAALAGAPAAWAQAAPKHLSSADQQFLTKAVQGNAAEASLGEVAAQKATLPAVQEFGRWMHTDHTLANNQLMAAAKAMHIQPPAAQPNAEQQSEAQSLQQVNGSQFDQQYIQHMVQDHTKDLQEYQTEASNGQNRMIKGYAHNMIPVIQAHLNEAQMLASNDQAGQPPVSGSTGKAAAGAAPGTGSNGTGAADVPK